MTLRSSYTGKQVVVTGGLGFVGSNLVLRLTELGAGVTVIDSKTPGCGANEYNIDAVRGQVRLIVRDIGEAG